MPPPLVVVVVVVVVVPHAPLLRGGMRRRVPVARVGCSSGDSTSVVLPSCRGAGDSSSSST
eukprot:6803161-Pyramimonas_sp.AAC.1